MLRKSNCQDDKGTPPDGVVVTQEEKQARMAEGSTTRCGYQELFTDEESNSHGLIVTQDA